MNQYLYKNCEFTNLSLRDHLAIERTSLANERTLLSYVRTMIGLIAVGGSLVKFFTNSMIILSGWIFVILGIVILVIGFARYLRINVFIQMINKDGNQTELGNNRLHGLFWLTLQKLHLSPSKARE